MKVLLDTHTLLWWIDDRPSISTECRRVIAASENLVYVSAASIWEMAIKSSLGKLRIPGEIGSFFSEHIKRNGFLTLDITASHALGVLRLPSIHKDPFDRMLISQSLSENMPLLTNDAMVRKYGVTTVW